MTAPKLQQVRESCERCRKRGKTWTGSDAKCAFTSGTFDSDNWNCATMNDLRALVEHRTSWNEDQNAAVWPIPGGETACGEFLILGWYKRRGRTEFAAVLDQTEAAPLALAVAEHVLRKAQP